jgi:hypothetical protein
MTGDPDHGGGSLAMTVKGLRVGANGRWYKRRRLVRRRVLTIPISACANQTARGSAGILAILKR